MGEELERMWQRAVSISSTELPRRTNTAFPAMHHPARSPPQPQLMPLDLLLGLPAHWPLHFLSIFLSTTEPLHKLFPLPRMSLSPNLPD